MKHILTTYRCTAYTVGLCALLLAACTSEEDPVVDIGADPALLDDVSQRVLVEVLRLTEAPLGGVGHIVTDSRGHVYVVDSQTNEMYEFTPAGELVRQFGRREQGPGEFESISQITVVPGDTLVIFDGVQRRVARWPVGADAPSWVGRLEGVSGTARVIPPGKGFVVAMER